MSGRRAVAKAVAQEYRKASKKEKGAILDRFVEATDYQRRYGPDCYGIKVGACRWEEPWWRKGAWAVERVVGAGSTTTDPT